MNATIYKRTVYLSSDDIDRCRMMRAQTPSIFVVAVSGQLFDGDRCAPLMSDDEEQVNLAMSRYYGVDCGYVEW